ncbi:cell division protein FtsQ/DivIB [Acetobacter sp. DsW_063]|uniref:cell division protein FtsQ/DivIB n=1 Tax=Acetobacter sp. DsW_063 TaxID=1514894 RepID=UPI0011786C8C|nr:cell division protein FtsQ/DivIB [Acetobacter sp. DsW_063]
MSQRPVSPQPNAGNGTGATGRRSTRMDRPSRIGLLLRRRKGLLKTLGLLGVVGAGGFAFLSFHGNDALLTPLRNRLEAAIPLKVTAIRVEGQNLTSLDSIRTALGVSVGDSMLGFHVTEARQRLDDLPFVDHASVERHLSGLIVVRLVERPPFAVWQNKGRFVLIDRNGEPVPDKGMTGKDAQAFMKLPLVVGEGAAHSAAELLDALAKAPDVSARMTAATLVGERRWSISLRDGTVVQLPEAEEEAALNRLERLQKQFGLLDRPVEVIDMRLPDRLTIRERQAPPTPDSTPGAAPADGHGDAAAPHSGQQPGAENGTTGGSNERSGRANTTEEGLPA